MKMRGYVLFFAAAAVVIMLVTVNLVTGRGEREDVASAPHFQTAPHVNVRITDEPQVSRDLDPVLVTLYDGAIPDDAANITVLSDENCQPDADGVSHCLNRVQFETAGGSGHATLQHHHRMAEEPCLAPGQMVMMME